MRVCPAKKNEVKEAFNICHRLAELYVFILFKNKSIHEDVHSETYYMVGE
jgi:hypothetical protein